MKRVEAGISRLLPGTKADAALIFDQGSFSHAQLEQRVRSLCSILSARAVQPGMTIGCAVESRLLNIMLMHALPRLGCIFLPLNPSLAGASIQRLVEIGKVDRLIATDCPDQGVILIDPEVLMPGDDSSHVGGVTDTSLPALQPHWLMATSGTQGEAKLVEFSANQLLSSVRASAEVLEFTGSDRWLACLPMFHIGGLMIPLRCAVAGATLVVQERFEPEHLWANLHDHQITHVSLVPAMLANLLQYCGAKPPPRSLRVMLVGGGALATTVAQAALIAGWPVCPSYGMTEAASQVATLYPPPSDYRPGLVGKPLPHLQVKIDPVSGRIMIRGESVVQGYVNQPKRRNEWFSSSDLGQMDEQGNLTVLGRADDMLISGGENIHPQQVEMLLMGCPGVEDVAVTGIQDAAWGDRLVALYVGDLPAQNVQTWSRAQLPDFMRPREFVQVDKLPRLGMGKLQRKALPELWVAKVSRISQS